jgi:hypothetical protein
MIKESYVKSPVELGIKTDSQGIYVESNKPRIEAMISTGLLEFGVGDTREDAEYSTIASRMRGHESSKNLGWQHYLLDSIPTPGYRDYALHKEIRQTFAAQLEDPTTKKRNEVFRVVVEKYLIEEFSKSKDFEPIRLWLNEKIRKCAAKLNPNHEKQEVNLRDVQLLVIKRVLSALRQNGIVTNFICELAARIGKTILFLELAKTMRGEFGHESMFIMAYGVGLGVKTSYKDEITKYSNFSDMQFIDTTEINSEEQYKQAMANNKMPIVFISLNPDVEEKYEWINHLSGTHIALLEETDFGTHTDSQVEKVDYILENKTVTRINASGTNISRLAKAFGKNAIDEIISVPYCMVEQDPSIPNVVVRRFYNMMFNPKMNKLLEDFDEDVLPNINKILEKGFSQEKFISAAFQDMLGYQPIYGMNLSDAAGEIIDNLMLFVNISKKSMEHLAQIIEKYCTEHKVLILNGDYTDNKEAEGLTKEELVRLQNEFYPGRNKLLVITNMMGTRSYSIPEIQACLFMQEGGDIYPYMQKYSRCLTPGFNKKYGYIFDFSFDQNKTRNTVMAVAVEATLLARQNKISYPTAVRTVLNSVNIKDMISGTWISDNDIILEFEDNNKLLAIANANTRITIEDLTSDEIEAFAEIAKNSTNSKVEKSKIDKMITTGKTFASSDQKRVSSPKNNIKFIVEKAIRSINSSSTTVVALTDYKKDTFIECLEFINQDESLTSEFIELYGFTPKLIISLSHKLEISTLDTIVYNSKYGDTTKHVENSGLAVLKDDPKLWRDIFSNRTMRRRLNSNKCKRILIVAGGHGTEVDVLVELFGIDIVSKIVYNDKYNFFCNQIKRKYPKITIARGNFIELEFNMEFDVIAGNPPYQGKAELHQKFFNKSVALLKEGGVMTFIQPATPYFNKKESIRANAKAMIENVKKFKSEVKIVSGSVFENAGIFTSLAITTLLKEVNPTGKLIQYQNESNTVYQNIDIDAVNMLEMDPLIYKSLVEKIFLSIDKIGTLQDLITTTKTDKKLYVQKIRGHIGHIDFYTFLSKDKKYWNLDTTTDYGIAVSSPDELDSAISYLTTHVARFCLSIFKFNGNNHMGEFRSVPRVPFNQVWNDTQLCEYFNISEVEYKEIIRCIPNYYAK